MTALVWGGQGAAPVRIAPFQTVNEPGVTWRHIEVLQIGFETMEAKDFGDVTMLDWA